MIDHVNLPVSDLAASRAFYDPQLALLGLKPLVVAVDVVGYGIDHCVFGIIQTTARMAPAHLAFKAVTRDQVRATHMALRISPRSSSITTAITSKLSCVVEPSGFHVTYLA